MLVLLILLRRWWLEQGQGLGEFLEGLVLVFSGLIDEWFLESEVLVGGFHFCFALFDQLGGLSEPLLDLL